MNYEESEKYIKSKGGKMLTHAEAKKFLQKNVQCPGDDQWCAIKEHDGTRDWVSIGN